MQITGHNNNTGKCIRRFGCIYAYCQEVVDIGVKSYIEKHAVCLKDYRIRPFLSIRNAHGDLCKHLGIDLSTDLNDLDPIVSIFNNELNHH